MDARIRRSALIIVLTLPLILLQGLPALAPAWLATRALGVPATVWATVGWFLLFILLSWRFSGDAGDENEAGGP